jgi:hypothetical protein
MPPTPPKNLDSVRELAGRYSEELTAQFRTLNLFVGHAGEIGRTHEVFLRGVLERFLPRKFACGSGFIASAEHVSTQQDIIVYDAYSLPMLLQVGDCVVCDADAVAGAVEVKTSLQGATAIAEVLGKLTDLGRTLYTAFVGLYAWEGASLETTLDCIWERYRALPELGSDPVPDAIYVRGKYLITKNNYDGRRETPPLRLLRLGEGQNTEGAGMLSFLEQMWMSGISHRVARPWWIDAWHYGAAERCELIPWPDDLQRRAEAEVAAIEAARSAKMQ